MKQIKALLTPYLCMALLLCSVNISAQYTCQTPPQVAPVLANLNPDPLNGDYCVTVYVEVDNDIVVERGGIAPATAFINGLLGEVARLYDADGITLNFITYYWQVPSPYNSSSSGELLGQFRTYRTENGGHDGDVAMLLSYQASGGIAFVDVICRESFGYSFSSIRNNYQPFPTYSWSLEVIAHELGHNLGSSHTQACVWNGNSTAIDGCSPFGTEGGCPDPGLPTNGGTVMSYCHLQSSVGIDFSLGFGPQPLAVIKNRIAAASCVECVDGPDDPEPDTCEGNQVIIEIQLDNYATETSWQVLNGDGAVVGASQPYGKLQMNTYHADTICLPDGCYSFVITDPDGLTGYGCSEGMYLVNGPNGELASGQAFTNSEITRFCFGTTPPSGDCTDLPLRVANLVNYANQSMFRFATFENVGDNGVSIDGNNWQASPLEYTVTPNTVLTFETLVSKVGEVNGIGLVPNTAAIYPSRCFRFAGRQAWGVPIEQVPVGVWTNVTIPVGQFMQGEVTHLVLVNDDDGWGQVKTAWRNVELCEDGASLTNKAGTQAQGTVEDEQPKTKPYPNPATDTLNLPANEAWEVYNLQGVSKLSGSGQQAAIGGLKTGIYFIRQAGEVYTIVKR